MMPNNKASQSGTYEAIDGFLGENRQLPDNFSVQVYRDVMLRLLHDQRQLGGVFQIR